VTREGHTVLQVPVPQLEDFVRWRHAHYDPGFVSADPRFVHAHVTVLGPFLPTLDESARTRLEDVLAATTPFDFVLERLATFPDGIIHLAPEPGRAFQDLTMRLFAAFPECPPYAGAYDEVLPHLTLDLRSAAVTEASTGAALGASVPARCRADQVDLAWWAEGDCRLLQSWRLGDGRLDGRLDGRPR
jgi:hypothetical protein